MGEGLLFFSPACRVFAPAGGRGVGSAVDGGKCFEKECAVGRECILTGREGAATAQVPGGRPPWTGVGGETRRIWSPIKFVLNA